MADLKEGHVGIKVYFKLGKMFTETFNVLKVAFVEQTVGRTQVFDWLSKFKSDVMSVEDADGLREGTYSQKNRGITIHEVDNSQKQKNYYP
jgi:hypothetical protein